MKTCCAACGTTSGKLTECRGAFQTANGSSVLGPEVEVTIYFCRGCARLVMDEDRREVPQGTIRHWGVISSIRRAA